jgi:hypothetical protein
MSTAVYLPPELFGNILSHVNDEAVLRDIGPHVRKETIKHLTTCSLVCMYWAQACRPKTFRSVSIQNSDDLFALSSLFLDTPARLTPVSQYINHVDLMQRLEDKPWIHAF